MKICNNSYLRNSLFLTLCLNFFSFAGNIIYVDQTATGGNTGVSWINAYQDLSLALNNATPGDNVWVASGNYFTTTGSDPSITFNVPEGIKLMGGFSGNEINEGDRNWVMNPTVLDGNIGSPGINTDNAYRIVNVAGNNIRIDGFIIQNGYKTSGATGAGIYASQVHGINFENLVIRNNFAGDGAGGVYVYRTSGTPISFKNCVIDNNETYFDGGGIYMQTTTDGDELINCVFTNNKAKRSGAGLLFNATGNVYSCTFYKNEDQDGPGAGGGDAGQFTIAGATTAALVKNCIIQGAVNTADVSSWKNGGDASGFLKYSNIQNSVIGQVGTGDTSKAVLSTGIMHFTPSFSDNIMLAGSDNVWFTDDDGLKLTGSSNSINTGTMIAPFTDKDILGKSRDVNPDMGAYEYFAPLSGLELFHEAGAITQINKGNAGNVLRFRLEPKAGTEELHSFSVDFTGTANATTDFDNIDFIDNLGNSLKSGSLNSMSADFNLLSGNFISSNTIYGIRLQVSANTSLTQFGVSANATNFNLAGGNTVTSANIISNNPINVNAPLSGLELFHEAGAITQIDKGNAGNVLRFRLEPKAGTEELHSFSVDFTGTANATTDFDNIDFIDNLGNSLKSGTLNSMSADFNLLSGNFISSNTIYGIRLQVSANTSLTQFGVSANATNFNLAGGNTVTSANIISNNPININSPLSGLDLFSEVGAITQINKGDSGNVLKFRLDPKAGTEELQSLSVDFTGTTVAMTDFDSIELLNNTGALIKNGSLNSMSADFNTLSGNFVSSNTIFNIRLQVSANTTIPQFGISANAMSFSLSGGNSVHGGLVSNNNITINSNQNSASIINIIDGGYDHMMLIFNQGVQVGGNNVFGQLGIGSSFSANPVSINLNESIKSIATGAEHSLALGHSGNIYSWGANVFGQLGRNTDPSSANIITGLPSNIESIFAGGYSSYALDAGGNLYAWGRGHKGQLGNGSTNDHHFPFMVAIQDPISSFSAGIEHALYVSNGNLHAFGSNGFGQLGTSTGNLFSSSPVLVNDQIAWSKVTAGGFHSTALSGNSTPYAWGKNTKGQLGLGGNAMNHTTPQHLTTISNIDKVAAGYEHTVFLLTDTTLKAAGDNRLGQLGVGGNIQMSNIPMSFGSSNYTDIACGAYSTIIIYNNNIFKVTGKTPLGIKTTPDVWLNTAP